MTEIPGMVERVKAAIAEKCAPAIDVRAPFAKVMFQMAAEAAMAAHEAALRDAGMVIVPRETLGQTPEDSHWGRFMHTGGSAPPDKSK